MSVRKKKRENYVLVTFFGLFGPLGWTLHFAILYLAQQLLCVDYQGEKNSTVFYVIVIVSSIILLAQGIFIVAARRMADDFFLRRQDIYSESSIHFLVAIARVMTGLSMVAVIWAALAVFFLNECQGAY